MLAIDGSGNAASNASGQLFATTDTAANTPLSPTDLFGLPFPGDTLTASALGILPAFKINGFAAVDWVSGSFRLTIPCIDQVPAGGGAGQVLAKTNANDYAVRWIDPPAGTGGGGTVADLPAGAMVTVRKSGSTWPARPTSRSDIIVVWLGNDPSPAIVTTGTGGMRNGIDLRFVTP